MEHCLLNNLQAGMAKKQGFFKKKPLGCFFLVLLGFIIVFSGFYWVLLILALPITGFYWVLLGFIVFFLFLQQVLGYFLFLPF